MKYTKILSAIAVILMSVVSCDSSKEGKEEAGEAALSTNVEELAFTQRGGSRDLSVVSNTDWTVVCSGNGFSVDPSSGTGNGKVTVTATPNDGYDSREGSVTVTAGGLSARVKLLQAQMDVISIDGEEYELDYHPVSLELKVGSNVDFMVNSTAEWVKVMSTKGLAESKVTLSVSENGTRETRETTVKISGTDVEKSVRIIQKPTANFPDSDEELAEANNHVRSITPAVQEIVDMAKSISADGIADAEEVSSKLLEIDGIVTSRATSSGNVVFMTKDSMYVNVLLKSFYDDSAPDAVSFTQTPTAKAKAPVTKANAVIPGGKDAIMLLPRFDEAAANVTNGVQYYNDIESYLVECGYSVDRYENDKATIDMFRGRNLEEYDVVYFNTHGDYEASLLRGGEPTTAFMTGSVVEDDGPSSVSKLIGFLSYCIWEGKTHYWITKEALERDDPDFSNTWICAHSCNSLTRGDFSAYCFERGAMGYCGFLATAPYNSAELIDNMFRSFAGGMKLSSAVEWTKNNSDSYVASIFDYAQKEDTPFYLVDPTPYDLKSSVNGTSVSFIWSVPKTAGDYNYTVYIDGTGYGNTFFSSQREGSATITVPVSGEHTWYVSASLRLDNKVVASYKSREQKFNVMSGTTINTIVPTNVGPSSAEIPYSISTNENVYEYGVIYSTDRSNPTMHDHGDGNYLAYIGSTVGSSTFIKELKPNTTYYARAFIVIGGENGTELCGNTVQFTTKGVSFSKEYEDLGLSVSWATCNLGSTVRNGLGAYYGWGETTPRVQKTAYKWGGPNSFSKYNESDGKVILEPSDDAAHVNLGGKWRMPTYEEYLELKDCCSWTPSTMGGVKGSTVTGPNGNSIFIPVSEGSTGGFIASFLTSTLSSSTDGYQRAYALYYSYEENTVSAVTTFRNWGTPVRPVYDDSDTKPRISVSPASINYGDVKVGEVLGNATGRVTFTNTGGADLSITGFDCPDGFSYSQAYTFPIVISPGESRTIVFAFKPTEAQTYGGYLQVYSDASNGTVKVWLRGKGVE